MFKYILAQMLCIIGYLFVGGMFFAYIEMSYELFLDGIWTGVCMAVAVVIFLALVLFAIGMGNYMLYWG